MRRSAFVAAAAAFAAAPRPTRAALDDDALFMQIANTVAARLAQDPPAIAYAVSGTVRAFHGESAFERRVRLSAGDADPPFLAAPNFDALSHWTFDMSFDETGAGSTATRTVDAHFTNISPLRYRTEFGVEADAVVNAVNGYQLTLTAPDHIALRRIDRKKHDASLHDLYFDPSTHLPTRVVYQGASDFFLDVGYGLVDNHLVVSNLRFGYVAYVFGHLVHSSFSCEATYSEFAFS